MDHIKIANKKYKNPLKKFKNAPNKEIPIKNTKITLKVFFVFFKGHICNFKRKKIVGAFLKYLEGFLYFLGAVLIQSSKNKNKCKNKIFYLF